MTWKRSTSLFLPALLSCSVADAQTLGASAWSEGRLSSARLIAGGFRDGVYSAGVEIVLKNGAHTYWRNPGDAGAPPAIGFDQSKNLGLAQLRYPAPKRILEDGQDIFGYLDAVILPLDVKPAEAKSPVDLAVDLQYAACARICIPETAHFELRLAPEVANSEQSARLAQVVADLPRPVGAGGPTLRIAPLPGPAKPAWRLVLDPPPGPGGDVFSEAPDGWYFSTHRAADGGFDLILEQKPDDAPATVAVRLTIFDGARAFETSAQLEGGGVRP